MAPYGVVFQILALVQWRAQAQAHYACTQLPSESVSHSGSLSQAEPDWQWIRICPADSGAACTVSDPVLGTMRQACNKQVANLG